MVDRPPNVLGFPGGTRILSIIIDGYNVIGISHRDREKAREQFIDLLIQYRNFRKHEITVVFDAYKDGSGAETRTVRGGVAIIYSGSGERADDVIKRIVSKQHKEWIVVSSDRDIVNHAWAADSIPVSSDRFLDRASKLVKAATETSGMEAGRISERLLDADFEDDVEEASPRRGNPYRLSKKERAIRKALNKL